MSDDKIILPELGEGVTEGELVKWLVAIGDSIQIDQPVAEVMTDKASMEVPSPVSGIVKFLVAQPGDNIQVGHTLLQLEKKSLKKTSSEESIKKNPPKTNSLENTPHSINKKSIPSMDSFSSQSADSSASQVLRASPLTRRLANKQGVCLSDVVNSNEMDSTPHNKRITKEDILQFIQKKETPVTGTTQRIPLKGVRKTIAQRMQFSKQNIPHFTLLESANLEHLDSIKKSAQEMLKDQNIKVTYLAFVMKALFHTVQKFPELNASIHDPTQEIILKRYYHFGFAADTDRGLLVPVIKNVNQKSLQEIAWEIQVLAEKARKNTIQLDEISNSTITVTNIGSLGGHSATPIINPPESAILGIYRLFIKPQWDGQTFQPQKTMNFSLTCDHRLIDGALCARALRFFVNQIENPLSLFI